MKYTATIKKEAVKVKQPSTSNQLKNNMKVTKDNLAKIMKSLQDT